MSFNSDFERAFVERSLSIVRNYQGEYETTLLLNCLLGLLVVPKQTVINQFPVTPLAEAGKWGVTADWLVRAGKVQADDSHPGHLRGLIWRLRNSVAHFRFEPVPLSGEVTAIRFTDQNGFEAIIPLTCLRSFVREVGTFVLEQ